MHLTNNEPSYSDSLAFNAKAKDAGAPAAIASAQVIEESIDIVEQWITDNSDAIRDNGGFGDVQSLLALLWASWKKLS